MKKNDSGTNINPTTTTQSSLDISPLLKEIYPTPKKRKTRSKRFQRIARLLQIEGEE